MPELDLQGRKISYTVVNGRSRNYFYLKFRSDLTLEVLLPEKGSVDVNEILNEKRDWLLRKYDVLAKSRKILSDGKLLFNGEYLKVVIKETGGGELRDPEVRQGEVVLYSIGRMKAKELVRLWFTKEAYRYLTRTIPGLAQKLAVRCDKVDVRETRKWGYCSRSGRVSFSWQLIALPEKLREYVVMHELVHLSVFSHSKAFRRKLASICPDYREREIELKRILPF